jgi:hypothetical protein
MPGEASKAAGLGLPYFPGAGERRSPIHAAQSRNRRALAAHVAAELLRGGVPEGEVYAAEASDTLLDLASDGQLREALGRARRRWAGFADQAQQRTARWGREYAAFCAASHIEEVIQVVVRAPEPLVPISDLRAAHAHRSAQLSDRLRYGRKQFAQDFTCDIIAAEIVAAAPGGDALDLHFHLAVRAATDDLTAMREYFLRAGWSWWDPISARSPLCHRPPGMLASYVGKGLAHALHRTADLSQDFTPENLAELYRQTRCLAMVRATGEFRTWKSGLDRDGLTVAEDATGQLVVRPCRPALAAPRFRKKLLNGACAQLLRLCVHDFGDGIKSPAMLVRGREDVTFAEVAAAYDLSPATISARRALPVLLRNTPKPEFYSLGSGRITVLSHFEPVSSRSTIAARKRQTLLPSLDGPHRSFKGNLITCN